METTSEGVEPRAHASGQSITWSTTASDGDSDDDLKLRHVQSDEFSNNPLDTVSVKGPKEKDMKGTVEISGKVRQAYAAFIVNLGVLGLGTVIGWSSPAIPSLEIALNATHNHTSLEDVRELTTMDKSWIGSIVNLGALLACMIGAFTIDKFGRKKSMIAFTFPFIAGWFVMMFIKAHHLELLFFGRFLVGFAAGFYGVSGPVFVGEIADESIRGFLSNFYGVFLTLGFLISYVFGTFLPWNHLSIMCAGIPVALLLLLFTIPETPRYYLQVGKEDSAIRSLCWYRKAKESEVQDEIIEMKKNIEDMREKSRNSKAHDLLAHGALKPLLISIALVFFEQFSGFPAIVAYTADIYKESKIEMDPNIATIVFGVAQLGATVVSSLIVDKVGRIVLLVTSQACNFVTLGILGLYFYFQNEDENHSLEGFRWVPIVCLVLYIVSLSIGIGPISTTLMGELLPQNIRGQGSAICTAILRLIAFLVSFGFVDVAEVLGTHWCFWIFSIVSIIGALYAYFCIPETKGKTLEEIRTIFLKKSG